RLRKPWRLRHRREILKRFIAAGFERRARRNRLVPEGRRGRAFARSQFHDRQPGRELGERESMQAKRRTSLNRNRASEIVRRTARCAEEKHLRAGFEPLQKPASLTKANCCGTGLNSHDNRIASPHYS